MLCFDDESRTTPTPHLLERASDGGRHWPGRREEERQRLSDDGTVIGHRARGEIIVGFRPARDRALLFGAIKKNYRKRLA